MPGGGSLETPFSNSLELCQLTDIVYQSFSYCFYQLFLALMHSHHAWQQYSTVRFCDRNRTSIYILYMIHMSSSSPQLCQLPTVVGHSGAPWSPIVMHNWLLMLQRLPSSPPCSMQHCAIINNSWHMPGQSKAISPVLVCRPIADDWDQQCKWSQSDLYLIARDRRIFPANANLGKP